MPFKMLRSPLSSTLPPEVRSSRRSFSSRSSSNRRASSWASKMPTFSVSLLHISILAVVVACSVLLHTTSTTSSSSRPPPVSVVHHTGTGCISRDHANPLASLFPNNATGVLNATLAIIPIPLATARRLIPRQYGILERAYRAMLPGFPEGMYPVLLQAAHDHDVQFKAFDITLEDFSRIGLEFPFVDLLGDGHSCFRWAPAQLITSDHEIALEGSRAYGTKVSGAEFSPACDAYDRLASGTTYISAQSKSKTKGGEHEEFAEVEVSALPHSTLTPYPLSAFSNMTNQPIFANGSSCDNMIRLFNTSMSTPVFVSGRVRLSNIAPFLESEAESEWSSDIYGVQVATPFIENNYLDCRSMQGYLGAELQGDDDGFYFIHGGEQY